MKKIILLLFILGIFHSAYSQQKCYSNNIEKQALIVDSLRNLIEPLENNISKFIDSIRLLQNDKIDLNKKILKDFEKKINSLNKKQKKIESNSLQKQVEYSIAQIAKLSQELSEKDKQNSIEKQECEQKLREEKERERNEAFSNIINGYRNKRFDSLIHSSTKLSVQRDMQLVGYNVEIKLILSDLEKYFNAEELLTKKIDTAKITNVQLQLNQIEQQSVLLEKIKENIEYYRDFNESLKETIKKLIYLDTQKIADSYEEIQKLKFQEILSELTNYIYNYYDYGNYLYLSDIIHEIIKRKRINADANITDLLDRL
jgi:hypothetical protein